MSQAWLAEVSPGRVPTKGEFRQIVECLLKDATERPEGALLVCVEILQQWRMAWPEWMQLSAPHSESRARQPPSSWFLPSFQHGSSSLLRSRMDLARLDSVRVAVHQAAFRAVQTLIGQGSAFQLFVPFVEKCINPSEEETDALGDDGIPPPARSSWLLASLIALTGPPLVRALLHVLCHGEVVPPEGLLLADWVAGAHPGLLSDAVHTAPLLRSLDRLLDLPVLAVPYFEALGNEDPFPSAERISSLASLWGRLQSHAPNCAASALAALARGAFSRGNEDSRARSDFLLALGKSLYAPLSDESDGSSRTAYPTWPCSREVALRLLQNDSFGLQAVDGGPSAASPSTPIGRWTALTAQVAEVLLGRGSDEIEAGDTGLAQDVFRTWSYAMSRAVVHLYPLDELCASLGSRGLRPLWERMGASEPVARVQRTVQWADGLVQELVATTDVEVRARVWARMSMEGLRVLQEPGFAPRGVPWMGFVRSVTQELASLDVGDGPNVLRFREPSCLPESVRATLEPWVLVLSHVWMAETDAWDREVHEKEEEPMEDDAESGGAQEGNEHISAAIEDAITTWFSSCSSIAARPRWALVQLLLGRCLGPPWQTRVVDTERMARAVQGLRICHALLGSAPSDMWDATWTALAERALQHAVRRSEGADASSRECGDCLSVVAASFLRPTGIAWAEAVTRLLDPRPEGEGRADSTLVFSGSAPPPEFAPVKPWLEAPLWWRKVESRLIVSPSVSVWLGHALEVVEQERSDDEDGLGGHTRGVSSFAAASFDSRLRELVHAALSTIASVASTQHGKKPWIVAKDVDATVAWGVANGASDAEDSSVESKVLVSQGRNTSSLVHRRVAVASQLLHCVAKVHRVPVLSDWHALLSLAGSVSPRAWAELLILGKALVLYTPSDALRRWAASALVGWLSREGEAIPHHDALAKQCVAVLA